MKVGAVLIQRYFSQLSYKNLDLPGAEEAKTESGLPQITINISHKMEEIMGTNAFICQATGSRMQKITALELYPFTF